jgi:hypothetical protein
MIVADMFNVTFTEGMAKTPSETPVKVVSSDIRTLRNRNSDGRRMVGAVRHTLGRRIPAESD